MQTDSIVVDSPPKSGSFQHLRSAALLGPDRRNLIEFYWQGGRLYKEDDSLKSRSEAEEIEGSIDRCLVTIEWAVVLDELADHVDPDVWPVLASKFIPEFEEACRRSNIDYRLWEPPTGRTALWWNERVSGCIRMFGTPGDCLPNPWVPKGTLPNGSNLQPPELCQRLMRRYIRYLDRLRSLSVYDCLAFQPSGDTSWGRLYAAGYAFRCHQVEQVASLHLGSKNKARPEPTAGHVSERPIENYSASASHAKLLYENQTSSHTVGLSFLAGVTLVTQLLLPSIMMVDFFGNYLSQSCPDSADIPSRVISALLFITIVWFGTFPRHAANDFLTYDIFLHSHAVTSEFLLKTGRFITEIILRIVVPVVMVYLLFKSPGLEFLLFNSVAVTFLAHVDNYAAQVYESIFIQRTGARGLAQHIRSKLLLEYLTRGSRITSQTRRRLNFRYSLIGALVKNAVGAIVPVAAIVYALLCLRSQ